MDLKFKSAHLIFMVFYKLYKAVANFVGMWEVW